MQLREQSQTQGQSQSQSDVIKNSNLISGRKYALASLGHVLVMGLGVSGRAVVEYCVPLIGDRIESLTVMGGRSKAETNDWASRIIEQNGDAELSIVFDTEDASSCLPENVDEFNLCIASPGISAFSDFYQNAQNVSCRVIGEIEFAWCESAEDSVWIAVTGTNGKTTTTSLIQHILAESGLKSYAVGNIGDACITQVARDLPEPCHYVVETSSYQLASIDRFAPDVAVLLGITPDHLKWHRTHEHYVESKFNLLAKLSDAPNAVAVLDATNDEVRSKVRELRRMNDDERGFDYVPIGTSAGIFGDMREACGSKNAAFVEREGEHNLHVALDGVDAVLLPASDLQILGEHNQLNALASASAALAAGVDASDVACALKTFTPLEHRIEPVGEVRGVKYYNDSKATNVDATLKALEAFKPAKPIVMLGGDDKGTDLSDLVESCRVNAKAIVCYGAAGPRFYEALAPLADQLNCQGAAFRSVDDIVTNKCSKKSLDLENNAVIIEQTFVEAFNRASEMAQSGDIVLLSPACASFDEFDCFEQRGDRFKELVAQLGD